MTILLNNNILKTLKYNGVICRNYSFVNNSQILRNSYIKSPNTDFNLTSKKNYTKIMDFPEIIWPSVLKTIKNWILVNLIIKPYFDKEFTLNSFSFAAKQALQLVSSRISSGDSLESLVASDAISKIQNSVSGMSIAQRTDLKVIKDDIYFSFPYQIGIMFDENDDVQKRWVEITMVFHVLRGLKEMQDKDQPPPINLGLLPEYRDKISICNYRFIKEFTQGKESDWTINIVNHFKPGEFVNE